MHQTETTTTTITTTTRNKEKIGETKCEVVRFERAPPEKETKPKNRNVRVSLHCATITQLKMESYFMYTNSVITASLDIVRMDMDISCHVV